MNINMLTRKTIRFWSVPLTFFWNKEFHFRAVLNTVSVSGDATSIYKQNKYITGKFL